MRENMKSFRRLVGVAAVTAAALVGISAAPAHAASLSSPSNDQIAATKALLTKFETPVAQQNALIAKARANKPWDVYVAGAPSVKEVKTIDGIKYNIDRYADGSVKATGIEEATPAPTGDFSTQQIVGCTVRSGSGYKAFTGCTVNGVWGSVLLAVAEVNYTINQGAPDQITNWGYGNQKCVWPTTCNSPSRVSSRATEISSGAAYAKWQSDVSSPGGSWNVWLQLNVRNDAAWQTNS